MTYQTFIKKTIEALSPNFPCETKFKQEKIQKNNGIVLRALIIETPECNIFPTIYLDEFYERAKSGEDLSRIFKDILETYQTYQLDGPVDTSCFLDFEKIKTHLSIRLVNRERNENYLKEVPWEPFLDLAVLCCIHYDTPTDLHAETVIRNSHLKSWNITGGEILKLAKENTPKLLPYTLNSLPKFLNEIAGEVVINEEEDCKMMHVLTNENRTNGACCMLYPTVLKEFSEKNNCNVYILPSSIHEVMLLCEDEDTTLSGLSELVHEVNETQVSKGEFLSDHAYYYNRETEEIVF